MLVFLEWKSIVHLHRIYGGFMTNCHLSELNKACSSFAIHRWGQKQQRGIQKILCGFQMEGWIFLPVLLSSTRGAVPGYSSSLMSEFSNGWCYQNWQRITKTLSRSESQALPHWLLSNLHCIMSSFLVSPRQLSRSACPCCIKEPGRNDQVGKFMEGPPTSPVRNAKPGTSGTCL